MKNNIIAVDMDDVLVGLLPAWLNYLNSKYNLNVLVEDILEWDMKAAYPMLKPEQIYGPLETDSFWETVKPLEFAYEYLYRLYCEGYKIVVVTASHPNTVRSKIFKSLLHYFDFLTYKDVIICSSKELIKAFVLVDDGPHNLKDFDGIRFLIDAPHNRKTNPDWYDYRVNNLKDVYYILKEKDYIK